MAVAAGRRFHTERLSLQGLRRPEDASAAASLRVGFTVTRKVGGAVERNRIRRRLRAAVAEAALPFLSEPADIVVIGRREALQAPFPQLVEDLGRALRAVTRPMTDGPGPRRPQRPRERDVQRRQ